MEQYQLKKPESIKKRKRIGRGPGSGHGKTSGRGQKGAGARSGSSLKAGFEGGQMPLQRRVPKRGFNNSVFKTEYQIVNLVRLEAMDLSVVDAEAMAKAGCIDSADKLIKILGNGELTKAISVTADAFSKSAKDKIEKAGGQATVRSVRHKKNKTE